MIANSIETMTAERLEDMKSVPRSWHDVYRNLTVVQAWPTVIEASRVDMASCVDADAAKEYVRNFIARPFLPLWNSLAGDGKARLISDLQDYPYGGATFIGTIGDVLVAHL